MPFLRVIRDKRGYDTTYLINTVKDGTRSESKVLYAFRSPGGVRVGRSLLEPHVRREIEAQHQDITFDWDTLLSGQQVIDTAAEPRRPRRRAPAADASSPPSPPPTPRRAEVPHAAPPRLTVPAAIEGDTPETRMRFLAHWHGILCEQLPERITDPERREALMALVQQLNPAGWIDPEEVAAGTARAGEALERLSRALSKRRRKPRRRSQRDPSSTSQAAAEGVEQDAAPAQEAGDVASDGEWDGDESPDDQPDSA